MFQFQPFTQAELDADPRLAALLEDKQRLLETIQHVIDLRDPALARDWLLQAKWRQERIERQREAAHYAAVQAENVRRGWRPATWREILGEPQYAPTHGPLSEAVDHAASRLASSDGCCHCWSRRPDGWSCSLGWKCPLLSEQQERGRDE